MQGWEDRIDADPREQADGAEDRRGVAEVVPVREDLDEEHECGDEGDAEGQSGIGEHLQPR